MMGQLHQEKMGLRGNGAIPFEEQNTSSESILEVSSELYESIRWKPRWKSALEAGFSSLWVKFSMVRAVCTATKLEPKAAVSFLPIKTEQSPAKQVTKGIS